MSRSKDAWAYHPTTAFAAERDAPANPAGLFVMATERVCIVDTETTGLQRDARIVEIAAAWLDLVRGEITDSRTMLVNPGMPIPRDATGVHGIRDRDVCDKPSIDRVLTPFFAFVGQGPVVAHNAGFDVKRLRFECERTRVRIPGKIPVWCSMKLARKAFPGRNTYRLDALAADLDLARGEQAHRAKADVGVTARLVLACVLAAKKDLRDIAPQEDTL